MHTTYDFNGCALALDARDAERAARRKQRENALTLALRVLRTETRLRELERLAGRARGERSARLQRAADRAAIFHRNAITRQLRAAEVKS